jgi:hypothetical protein
LDPAGVIFVCALLIGVISRINLPSTARPGGITPSTPTPVKPQVQPAIWDALATLESPNPDAAA